MVITLGIIPALVKYRNMPAVSSGEKIEKY